MLRLHLRTGTVAVYEEATKWVSVEGPSTLIPFTAPDPDPNPPGAPDYRNTFYIFNASGALQGVVHEREIVGYEISDGFQLGDLDTQTGVVTYTTPTLDLMFPQPPEE